MTLADRIAGAPISWGVCEVPGWGYQLTPDRVLAEMRAAGLAATEFGPAASCPTTRRPRRKPLPHSTFPVSAGSCRSCCTIPAATRCPAS